MAAPKVKTLIQKQIKGKTNHHAYIEKTFISKEGEDIEHSENEIPQSLIDKINNNGGDVLNWQQVAIKSGAFSHLVNSTLKDEFIQ